MTPLEQEREKFEAWATQRGYCITRTVPALYDYGDYIRIPTQHRWEGWKGAKGL